MATFTASFGAAFGVLTILLAAFASPAYAETRATVDQFFGGLLSLSSKQCEKRNDKIAEQYEAQGRLAEAHSIRSAEGMVCECMPARVRSLRGTISKEESARTVSEAEFGRKYLGEIVNPCAAAQLKSTYGEGCADRWRTKVDRSAKFCACMASKLGEMPDDEIAEIGRASADYVPLAADAKKRGLPPPAKPPSLAKFGSIETVCLKE